MRKKGYLRDKQYRQEQDVEIRRNIRNACKFTNFRTNRLLDDHLDTLVRVQPRKQVEDIYAYLGGSGDLDSCEEKKDFVETFKKELTQRGFLSP